MTTLLDKPRPATTTIQEPAEATLDEVLSHIAALAPMMQRRLRDLRVAAQHTAVHPRHYVTAAATVLARFAA